MTDISDDPVLSFDLTGALPAGRLVLEASAGTGKTYTVAALVTRLVAESGLNISQILVTTFTRLAAQELRDRIRRRLIETFGYLEDATLESSDPLIQYLRSTTPEELALRVERLQEAVAGFDTATISTIHSLCQRLLLLAGRSITLSAEDASAGRLVAEVANDHLVASALRDGKKWEASRIESTLDAALRNSTATLWVPPLPTDGKTPKKAQLDAIAVRDLIAESVSDAEQRMATRPGFEGLLREAARTVSDPANEGLRAAIRSLFPFAIVDESQDTDPLQWQLLEALYPPTGDAKLIIVGDPKQSIYSFRGANVRAYLAARNAATQRSLDVNWRSDEVVLTVLNALFQNASFGQDIEYRQVRAAPGHEGGRVAGGGPSVEIILVPTDAAGDEPEILDGAESEGTVEGDDDADKEGSFEGATTPTKVSRDDVAQVVSELLSGMTLVDDHGTARALTPPDIAVLVETNWEGRHVVTALRGVGIPAVSRGAEGVAKSQAAVEWTRLARALTRPAAEAPARVAAIGWFGNQRQEDLVTGDDAALRNIAEERLTAMQETLAEWASLLRSRGVAALARRLLEQLSTMRRMAADDGERHLADFQHMAELLHDHTQQRGVAPEDLLHVLVDLRELTDQNELVARRTESDAAAVQVLTVHSAKGLEFPVVLAPSQWKRRKAKGPPIFHPEATGSRRILDASWASKGNFKESAAAMEAEQAEEQLRLFYVAATRAKHHLVLWIPVGADGLDTAPSRAFGLTEVPASAEALHQLISARDPAVGPLLRVRTVQDVESAERPDWSADPGDVDVEALVTAPTPPRVRQSFNRWSFSVLVDKRHPDGVAAGRATDEFLDVGERARPATTPMLASEASTSRLATLPAGAEFGSMIHEVLERVDPGSATRGTDLAAAVAQVADTPALRPRHDDLVAGLDAALCTPLGPISEGLALADLPPRSILSELDFDLTLADRGLHVEASAIGQLLLDHLPSTDPLYAYAARLLRPKFRVPLGGLLTGSIDVVMRLPGTPERILIADYKSNRLDDGYHEASLRHEMAHHHYPLQGLLYLAAIHRFLRWRTGEVDPSTRVAGFAYLFVRGMVGPDTARGSDGTPHGVFTWSPPAGLLGALSNLLTGEVTP